MASPGRGVTAGPDPEGSTSEMDGRHGSLRGPTAKKPSSLNILASLNNKRKASDMEETEDSYNASHIRSPIKQEPGLPIDDSHASRDSISPSMVPIKLEPSTENALPTRDNDNSKSREDKSKPSSRLDEPLPLVNKEADSPDHDSREGSDVEDRASSKILSEPDMWDVSESEFHTSEAEEEDSSDSEKTGSERDERGEPDESSRGPDNLHEEESDEIVSRRRTVRNQNSNSRKRPSEVTASGSNETEQDTPPRGTQPDHGNPASRESSESPAHRRDMGTTTAGNPRKRAAPKKLISARNISRSWKTATPADKMLMKMKEKGCDWLEIRKAWQEITGEWPATSTLPNRYQRIKNNLTRLKSGDRQRLLNAAAEVEAQFQREKWRLIAQAMERAGAAKYSNAFIQKKCDELSRDPSMFDARVDDESSDASESNPTPSGVNVANSTMATVQARSENSRRSSHVDQPGTAARAEPTGSGHRQKDGPKVPFSHEQGKRIAKQRALVASDKNKPKSKPYQCQSCFGRYKKREGLGAHWKRNPGCDPETRRRKAAKSVSKETAAEYTPGISKSKAVAEVSSPMPKTQMVFEISSKEQTPEMDG